jgi:hypothetical protein
MESVPSVNVQRVWSKQLGQFASRIAARKVHLEKPVLPVNEARAIRKIHPVPCCNHRDTASVSLDTYICGYTFRNEFAVQSRQTFQQHRVHQYASDQSKTCRRYNESGQNSFHTFTLRESLSDGGVDLDNLH